MPEKFEVGDIVVCMDDSLHGGYDSLHGGYDDDKKRLELGKTYEVSGLGGGEVYLRGVDWTWKQARFRRATLDEARQYRRGQGYEKHPFAVGDIVVGICGDKWFGKSFCVKSATTDYDGEPMVSLDGDCGAGLFAARFRTARPAEAEAYRKAKEKATVACVAGCDFKPGQLVTVSISDKPPFQAVVLEAPTANDPYVKLSSAAGIDWASAEAGPSFNVTFTWEGPEKMPMTGNDAPEAINKAIAVPNPQMLTSADGREFDIIDWKPTVSTGEVVKVEANMVVRQAKDKPKSLTDGLVGAWAPKPAASAWVPKPGDLVVCIDAEHSVGMLEAGKVYEVSGGTRLPPKGFSKSGEKIVLQNTSLGVGRESGWYINRFRPATPEEICDYHKEKGFPDHQFNVGDIVVAVDVRMADGTRLAPNFAVGSVHEVEYRSGIGIRVSGCERQGFWNVTRFRKATPAERFQFFKEKLNKEGPGDGYRFLDNEERLDESDEVFDSQKGTWVPTIRVGETAGTGPNRYRRRNKFAEGELVQIIRPATEQERNRSPHWTDTLSMNRLDGKVLPMPKTRTHTHRRDSIYTEGWEIATDWLAPATKDQKVKKAKIQELEARMKDIQSELSSLKGT